MENLSIPFNETVLLKLSRTLGSVPVKRRLILESGYLVSKARLLLGLRPSTCTGSLNLVSGAGSPGSQGRHR